MFASATGATLRDGRRVVVKAGPAAGSSNLLSYERDLMRTEAEVFRLAAGRPRLPMPSLLAADFTRTVIDSDYLVVTWLDGRSWDSVAASMSPTATERATKQLAEALAVLHQITGPSFGYFPSRAPELSASSWPEAFSPLVESLLSDAVKWGVQLDFARIRAVLASSESALGEVTVPQLVHADAWPGNVCVDAKGTITGIIDFERAFWGDPLFDLVGAEPMSTAPPNPTLSRGMAFSGDELVRLDLYRVCMTLMLIVEIVPRGYTFDWIPNHSRQLATNLGVVLSRLPHG